MVNSESMSTWRTKTVMLMVILLCAAAFARPTAVSLITGCIISLIGGLIRFRSARFELVDKEHSNDLLPIDCIVLFIGFYGDTLCPKRIK